MRGNLNIVIGAGGLGSTSQNASGSDGGDTIVTGGFGEIVAKGGEGELQLSNGEQIIKEHIHFVWI